MNPWRGFLGLGGTDVTQTEWKILEVLVRAEACSIFGTRCPTVDEMSLAARALRRRFQSDGELKAHLRGFAKWRRRILRKSDQERREARKKRIAATSEGCGRHPAPISFFPSGGREALVLCHACAMERHSLDKAATIVLDIEILFPTGGLT